MTRRTLILPAQYALLTVACVFGTLAVAASKIAHDGLDLSERLRGWARMNQPSNNRGRP